MPYTYRIYPEVNAVVITHSGSIETWEASRQFEELLADPAHQAGRNIIRDTTDAKLPIKP